MQKYNASRGTINNIQNINTNKNKFLDDPVSLKNLSQDFFGIIFCADISKA
ncbi:hypothetical protein TUM13066_26730 [Escherichia coli]|nr:hypothetical protein ECABU_c12270 [Escherichia coli ABU 83972]SHD58532.1 conserved hypothetical protein [Escherichia coli]BDP05596.1 hypothetical protein TUM13066_26730 [Escherichia coli]BEU31756.1 hypothetical protein GU2018CL13_28200 [Escherichia coli]GHO27127.1 hypothetical protein MY013_29380 [Escherichia coli]